MLLCDDVTEPLSAESLSIDASPAQRRSARLLLCALVLTLATTFGATAAAQQSIELAGVSIPTTTSVQGRELTLAACGVRDTLWIDHYLAALYLAPNQAVPAALQDAKQPKAIFLHILRSASLPEQIPEQWREPLRQELAGDALALIRRAYGRLEAGDRVWLRYAPQQGVSIFVGDRLVAKTQDHALIDAVLATWSGNDPLSGKLRRLLLKHPC